MKNFSILLFLVLGLFISPLPAKAIHFLGLGGPHQDDDESVRIRVTQIIRNDLKNTQKIFQYIATVTDVPLYSKIFTEDTATWNNVHKWIRQEVIANDDIIILYYSGHGIRTKHSPTRWPSGCFSLEDVDFTKIFEKILSKKAALSIAILDCCNQFKAKSPETESIGAQRIPSLSHLDKQRIADGCKKLFFTEYGLIIGSGAIPGKPSHMDSFVLRSYYTSSFLVNLVQELQTSDPQWERIFKTTKSDCYRLPWLDTWIYDHQYTQHQILIDSKRRSPKVYKQHLYK